MQVGRVRRSVQQRDIACISDSLAQRTTLVARIVQDQGDRHLYAQGSQLPSHLADACGVDVGEMGEGDPLVRDRMERAQHVKALPPTWGFDPAPGEAPEVSQKRAEDNMRCLYKKDRPLTSVRLGSAGLQLFFDTPLAPQGRLGLAATRPCDVADRGV